MLDDPVLARGMLREEEERLGSMEATEKYIQDLRERSEQEEAAIESNRQSQSKVLLPLKAGRIKALF